MVVVSNLHLSTCMWMEGRGVRGMWYGHGVTYILVTQLFFNSQLI